MSCQGVSDEIFLKKLNKAMQKLNKNFIIGKMYKKICELADQDELSEHGQKSIMRKVRVYFGTTRRFESVLKAALTYNYQVNKTKRSN